MRSGIVMAALIAMLSTSMTLPVRAHEGENHSAVPQTAEGEGVVKAIDSKAGTITIKHGPIAAIKWPAMTMTFPVASPSILNGITVDKKIRFVLENDHGKPTVSSISPL